MKQRLLLLSLLFLLLSGAAGFAVEIDRMEPPFWYTGMQNRELQVLFHGKDIAKAGCGYNCPPSRLPWSLRQTLPYPGPG